MYTLLDDDGYVVHLQWAQKYTDRKCTDSTSQLILTVNTSSARRYNLGRHLNNTCVLDIVPLVFRMTIDG